MALKDPTENLNAYLSLLPAVRHSLRDDYRLPTMKEEVLYIHIGQRPLS